jgi:hypothetical protein
VAACPREVPPGLPIRQVVPAIVASLAVYAGLAIAAAGLLRERYLTPLVTSSPNVPGTAWLLGQSWTKDGRFVFAGNPPSTWSTGSAMLALSVLLIVATIWLVRRRAA